MSVILHNRLESHRIEVCLSILQRTSSFATKPESICELLNKYEEQLDVELLTYARIGRMNESAAKSNLERCDIKRLEMQQRCVYIENLME